MVKRSRWGLTRSPSQYERPNRSVLLARSILQRKYGLTADDAQSFIVNMQLELQLSRREIAARIIRELGD